MIPENTLNRYWLFQVVNSNTDLTLKATKQSVDLTAFVNRIDAEALRSIEVKAAVTGVNGQHLLDLTGASVTVGETYSIALLYNELDLGNTLPIDFDITARTTNTTTLASDIASQIQGDARYPNLPFTVSAAAGVLTFTDAPKGQLIAGEATALSINTNIPGAAVTLNNVANVKPFGQPAQLKRIQEKAGDNRYPSTAPNIHFIGTVNDATVYTTVLVAYRLNKGIGNPVSEAASPYVVDAIFIDEGMTDFTVAKETILNYAGFFGVAEGESVTMAPAASAGFGSTVAAGVTSVDAAPSGSNVNIYVTADMPVGSELSIANTNGGGGTALTVNGLGGEQIDGGASVSVAAASSVVIRKVSSGEWKTV